MKDNVNNQEVLVSRSLSEPHIYIAFTNRWDSRKYQDNTKNWEGYRGNVKFLDQMGVYKMGNYTFERIDLEKIDQYENMLLVGKPEEFSDEFGIVKQFDYPDEDPAIYVTELENKMYANNI